MIIVVIIIMIITMSIIFITVIFINMFLLLLPVECCAYLAAAPPRVSSGLLAVPIAFHFSQPCVSSCTSRVASVPWARMS